MLCPFEHGSDLFAYVADAARKWTQLNSYQRCLWFVDEVEVRWSLLKSRHSQSAHFEEGNWTDPDDFEELHVRIAKLLAKTATENAAAGKGGVVVAKRTDSTGTNNRHTSTADYTQERQKQYAVWEQAYQDVMGFSKEARHLMKQQQF